MLVILHTCRVCYTLLALNIVKKRKSDDFEKYVSDAEDKLYYTRNDACVHKYDVLRTVNILVDLSKQQ